MSNRQLVNIKITGKILSCKDFLLDDKKIDKKYAYIKFANLMYIFLKIFWVYYNDIEKNDDKEWILQKKYPQAPILRVFAAITGAACVDYAPTQAHYA